MSSLTTLVVTHISKRSRYLAKLCEMAASLRYGAGVEIFCRLYGHTEFGTLPDDTRHVAQTLSAICKVSRQRVTGS